MHSGEIRREETTVRIDKLISDAGLASRREAARLARGGAVLVDGIAVKDLSVHIDPSVNRVSFMGREIVYSKYIYVMLNKPAGYVSATEDSRLPVVTELLSDELQRRELFPMGRLDRDTTGLMILTNNGPLSHALLSPKRHVAKEYFFTADEPLREGAETDFESGITLADGYECKPAQLTLAEDRRSGIILLTEGKYHQIKRMVAAEDNRVTSLKRISFAGIPLDETLLPGEWRFLTDDEVKILENANKS